MIIVYALASLSTQHSALSTQHSALSTWFLLSSAPLRMNVKKRLLDGPRMNRAIRRMAIEIVEKNRGIEDLLIVGIRSRGVPIGERIAKEIGAMEGEAGPFGILDITLYRDDPTT